MLGNSREHKEVIVLVNIQANEEDLIQYLKN